MDVFKTPSTRELFTLGSYVTWKLCQTNYSIRKLPFLGAYILLIILECPPRAQKKQMLLPFR